MADTGNKRRGLASKGRAGSSKRRRSKSRTRSRTDTDGTTGESTETRRKRRRKRGNGGDSKKRRKRRSKGKLEESTTSEGTAKGSRKRRRRSKKSGDSKKRRRRKGTNQLATSGSTGIHAAGNEDGYIKIHELNDPWLFAELIVGTTFGRLLFVGHHENDSQREVVLGMEFTDMTHVPEQHPPGKAGGVTTYSVTSPDKTLRFFKARQYQDTIQLAERLGEESNVEIGTTLYKVDGGNVLEGILRFKGSSAQDGAVWGVEMLAENEKFTDGSLNGTPLFECEPNHALFCSPSKLFIGKKWEILDDLPSPSETLSTSESAHFSDNSRTSNSSGGDGARGSASNQSDSASEEGDPGPASSKGDTPAKAKKRDKKSKKKKKNKKKGKKMASKDEPKNTYTPSGSFSFSLSDVPEEMLAEIASWSHDTIQSEGDAPLSDSVSDHNNDVPIGSNSSNSDHSAHSFDSAISVKEHREAERAKFTDANGDIDRERAGRAVATKVSKLINNQIYFERLTLQMFHEGDEDENGTLDVEELTIVAKKILNEINIGDGFCPTSWQVFFDFYDKNENGKLDLTEFRELWGDYLYQLRGSALDGTFIPGIDQRSASDSGSS